MRRDSYDQDTQSHNPWHFTAVKIVYAKAGIGHLSFGGEFPVAEASGLEPTGNVRGR